MTKSIYSSQFKDAVLYYIKVEKHSIAQASAFYDVPKKTIEKWVTKFNKENRSLDKPTTEPTQLMSNLEREIARLKEENDILKKTISLLARKE